MSTFSIEDIRTSVRVIADHVERVADKLNRADGKLGDGDLGITVAEGWREIANNAQSLPDDVGMAFLECSKCFQRASSSSFGTLVATAFMSAAKTCKGSEAVPYASVSNLLKNACQAMIIRGKGQLGDKSILDMMQAMAVAAEGVDRPDQLLDCILQAVEKTLTEFRGKQNKLGRARMFGEKSVGLDDPGMLAVQEMIKAFV